MKKGKIIIISGPSGSGKTTLYQKILASQKFKNKLARSISVTTRPRRKGERHGRDYFFVSRKMFEYKKRKGHLLESESVFGNYYGTPNKYVKDLLAAGKNVLLSIDVKGARTVRKKFPSAVTIFVKTPSMGDLKKRLEKRGSEDPAIVKLRLERASKELKAGANYKYIIVNDNLQKAYGRLEKIILKELG